jgi:hypothetical protein
LITMAKRRIDELRRKHYFFLNPYRDAAFTRCPKCERPTKLRKFPLAIHIEPRQLFILNKTCRYCERCELIIVKKSEVESLMAAGFERQRPEIIGNKYLVFGVLERKDWLQSKRGHLSDAEVLERALVFKDVWNFKLVGGWMPDPKARRSKR